MFYRPTNIYYLLNTIALAHWIMGDGSYQPGGSLVLCTDSFSLQDVICLINVLIVRYGLECSLTFYHSRSNQKLYRIRISKKKYGSIKKCSISIYGAKHVL